VLSLIETFVFPEKRAMSLVSKFVFEETIKVSVTWVFDSPTNPQEEFMSPFENILSKKISCHPDP